VIRAASGVILALSLAACPGPVREPTPSAPPAQPAIPRESPAPPAGGQVAPAGARTYRVVPEESLLLVLAYRGGALARAGHNHVIASREVSGTVRLATDVTQSLVDLKIPVSTFTIDDRDLRLEQGTDFPPDVPESAKEGTRKNMLGAGLLDSEHFPAIQLRTEKIVVAAPGALQMTCQVTVRDQTRSIVVPVTYRQVGAELRAEGELQLKQSELGLTPFSVMMGALQVQDDMRVQFRIVARAPR